MQTVVASRFAEEDITPTVTAVMHAVHAVAARPALWTTGLPDDILPLPSSVTAQCWLVCTYAVSLCAVAIPLTIAATREVCGGPARSLKAAPTGFFYITTGLRHDLAPVALPYVTMCGASALWILLGFFASSM